MKKSLIVLTTCMLFSISTLGHATSHTKCTKKKCPRHAKRMLDIKQMSQPDTAEQAASSKLDESETKSLTGSMTFTSNYVFRGISQTRNEAAVQGSLTYTPFINNGPYMNIWGSNVSFAGSAASLELDGILGWTGNLFNENLGYDISFGRYNYPRANELSYNEVIGSLTYSIFKALIGYSPNVYNSRAPGTYYNGSIDYNIPPRYTLFHIEDVSLQAGIGHYSLPLVAGKSYNDYSVALNKKINIYTLTLQWTGTDGRNNNPPVDDDHIFGMITANFS